MKVRAPRRFRSRARSRAAKGGQKRLSLRRVRDRLWSVRRSWRRREEYFELCEPFLPGGELLEARPRPSLGKAMTWASRASVLDSSRISVAGTLHGEAGYVEDPLLTLPQQSQEQSRAASWLID